MFAELVPIVGLGKDVFADHLGCKLAVSFLREFKGDFFIAITPPTFGSGGEASYSENTTTDVQTGTRQKDNRGSFDSLRYATVARMTAF